MRKKQNSPIALQSTKRARKGKIYLAAYFITIRNRGERFNDLNPFDYDYKGTSLINELQRIIPDINYIDSEESARTFKITSMKYDDALDYYKCSAMCGAYGRDFEVIDVETNAVTHKGKPNEAPQQEFNFIIKFKKARPYGYIIFQRNSNWGVRTTFSNALKDAWDQKEYTIHISPCAIKQVIEMYKESDRTTEVTFIQHTLPQSVFERLEFESRKSDVHPSYSSGRIEIKIKAGRMSFIKGIAKRLIESEKPDANILDALNIKSFSPDQMMFTLEDTSGRKKNFVLKKDKEPRTYLEVTNDVIIDSKLNKNALFSEMHKLALSLP